MTLANPNILWDVGFQLSFAATLGLMVYIDPWKQWVETGAQRIVSPKLAKRAVRFFGDIFIATLAATLLTMPLIIYHFSQLSIVSPLANLLVLPAQPGVMSWGILATVAGMVFPLAGRILAWIAWPFLTYTISRARLFASLPGASIPLSLSASGVVAIYALILTLTWQGWKGRDGSAELFGRFHGGLVRRITLIGPAIIAVIAVAQSFRSDETIRRPMILCEYSDEA